MLKNGNKFIVLKIKYKNKIKAKRGNYMNNKKITIFVIIIIIIILSVICTLLIKQKNKSKFIEYTPQEELSKEQERNTIISLYFKNKQTNELIPEARIIDSKMLLNDPYTTIINLLIEGPKSDKLETTIPEGTKVKDVKLYGNILYIDFSNEFIVNNKKGIEEESKIIYALVNSLTELNEVSYIRILIEGEENRAFDDNAINFRDNFARND